MSGIPLYTVKELLGHAFIEMTQRYAHLAPDYLGREVARLPFATRGAVGTLLSGVVFADWIFFGLGAASIFTLRRTRPDLVRPYRVLGYPWLPAFFVICAGVGVVSAYVSAFRMSLVGTAMLAVGALVFRLRRDERSVADR